MKWMMKNSAGKPDAMLTFAAISFAVVTLNLLLSSFGSFDFKELAITFNALDASVMSAYLGVAFTAYVSRRWTDKRYTEEVTEEAPPSLS